MNVYPQYLKKFLKTVTENLPQIQIIKMNSYNFVTPRPDYFSSNFEEKSCEIIFITNLEIVKIGEKQFQCPICDLISRTKYVYKSCDFCDRSFSFMNCVDVNLKSS